MRKLISGEAESESDSGFGIANVEQRIHLGCGEKYGVHAESTYGSGTTVTVRAPALGKEVREAGIPLIVADRNVSVEDDSLITAWVGSDCLLEGNKVCEWLNEYCRQNDISPTSLKIVNIQGTDEIESVTVNGISGHSGD